MPSWVLEWAGALIRSISTRSAATASRPVGLLAPPLRRLRHDLVDEGEQQFVLGGEQLVEGPQRGLRPLDHLEHREVGPTRLAEDGQRRLHESLGAGLRLAPSSRRGSARQPAAAGSRLAPVAFGHENDVTAFVESAVRLRLLCCLRRGPPAVDRLERWTHDNRQSSRRSGRLPELLDLFDANPAGTTASPCRPVLAGSGRAPGGGGHAGARRRRLSLRPNGFRRSRCVRCTRCSPAPCMVGPPVELEHRRGERRPLDGDRRRDGVSRTASAASR